MFRIKSGQAIISYNTLANPLAREIISDTLAYATEVQAAKWCGIAGWLEFLPSEWQDFNVPPSPAVAPANLLLPDVIKESWSSEQQRGAFLGLSPLLSGHSETHSTLSRHSLSGTTPDAGTLGSYTGKRSQWIKKLFYHHLDWLLKTLL